MPYPGKKLLLVDLCSNHMRCLRLHVYELYEFMNNNPIER